MGRIIASCGHELTEEEGIGNPIEYVEWIMDRSQEDGGMKEAIIYAVMCKECLKQKWLKKAMKRVPVLRELWSKS